MPQRVWFLGRFVLEWGMVYEENRGVYKRIHSFNSEWVRKKEKMRIRNGFEEFLFLRSNLSNDGIISALRPGLKTGMDFRGLVRKRVWKMTFF